MNTGLAQIVALTAHGNAALRGARHTSLDQSNLFQYVALLNFGMEKAPLQTDPGTPSEWFASLPSRDIRQLRMIRFSSAPDAALKGYDRSAFANGEQAGIAAIDGAGGMELWVPQWISMETEGQHQWALRYRGMRGGAWSDELRGHSVTATAARLALTLHETAAFAGSNGMEHWVDNFESAASILTSTDPVDDLDMLPPSVYPDASRRLLSAAMSGWVFGGMGSWNDTGPDSSEQQPRYEELTQQLYDTIMDSLVAACAPPEVR